LGAPVGADRASPALLEIDGLSEAVYVGRQAIFDTRRRVRGYELLYRSSVENEATIGDGLEATRRVVSAAMLDFGLEHLVSDGLAFVNVTREFLLAGLHLALPATRVVLEVLEHEVADRGLIELLASVRAEGYQLALDDYVPGSDHRRLIASVDIVKVDLLGTPRGDLARLVDDVRSEGVVVLAEKVESAADLRTVSELGIELLQGFFFQRPEVLAGRRATLGQLPAVRLLASVDRADASSEELEAILASEPGLAFRLLRLVNSAALSPPRPVTSLRDALVLLGRQKIKNLALVAMVQGVGDKTTELATVAMVRAKMCELLADPGDGPAAFLVGVLSVLDAVFDTPVAGLVEQLALSAEVRAAVVDRRGPLGGLLDLAVTYERGEDPAGARPGLTTARTRDAYVAAVRWADETMRALGGRAG